MTLMAASYLLLTVVMLILTVLAVGLTGEVHRLRLAATAATSPLKVGKILSPFSGLEAADGGTYPVTFDKDTVVMFVSPGCPKCQRLLPKLEKARSALWGS